MSTSRHTFKLATKQATRGPVVQRNLTPHAIQQRHFSASDMVRSSDSFLAAVKARRTYYDIEHSSPISDSKIIDIVNQTVLHAPSSFNSQTTRVVVILGDEHTKLWKEIVIPAVQTVAPEQAWPATEKKLNSLMKGYGTILLYENPKDVAALQEAHPLYSQKFSKWSEQTNAMHTYILWTALEQFGFGANLQHYNPLIDAKISERWNVPASWDLKGQLVFGTPVGKPREKTYKPLEERVFVHGSKL